MFEEEIADSCVNLSSCSVLLLFGPLIDKLFKNHQFARAHSPLLAPPKEPCYPGRSDLDPDLAC